MQGRSGYHKHAGKLSNHQDSNKKRRFQKWLSMTTPVGTIGNTVCHSDNLEEIIIRPHLNKPRLWWSEQTSQMEHNRWTNFRPRKRSTLGLHFGTTRNPSPKPTTQDISIPFSQIKTLAVDIPVDPQRRIGIYLDDCITVIPDISNNRSRVNGEMSLTIHAVLRPLDQK